MARGRLGPLVANVSDERFMAKDLDVHRFYNHQPQLVGKELVALDLLESKASWLEVATSL